MKLALQLAYKNLIGAGLRTWLNVGVLSFAFVLIILYNGILDGWNEQARRDTIAWEYADGHLVNSDYDPYDPFSILDGHGIVSESKELGLDPILIRQATLYPQGRMIPTLIKGIDPQQDKLELPAYIFNESSAEFPALIGKRMAENTKLKEGDQVLLRWRDKDGTYDAASITIVGIFDSNVPTIDQGQIWFDINDLWKMTELQDHATLYITPADFNAKIPGWDYQSQDLLLEDLNKIIDSKKVSSSIMYGLLMAIALLAIFDTQVLSIFRRQKEIGTYIALGMTRWRVVGLFTIEGTMYSILATLVGCIYGIPIWLYMAKTGMAMPEANQDMGISVAERIFPVYGLALIVGTVLLVVISSTIVSFLPARKISKMDPVDALKGKMQ